MSALLLALFLCVLHVHSRPLEQQLKICSTELEALDVLEGASPELVNAELPSLAEIALKNGWFELSQDLVELSRTSQVDIKTKVRQTIDNLKGSATEVLNLLSEPSVEPIAPAFQWAQSPETIFIEVKFGHRLSGPPAVLSLQDEEITLSEDRMHLRANGASPHADKVINLDLSLAHEIDPEASTWSFSSVGRMQFKLAKAERRSWNSLLAANVTIPKNMAFWWDMQSKYEEAMDKLENEEREKERQEKKKRKKEAKQRELEEKKQQQDEDESNKGYLDSLAEWVSGGGEENTEDLTKKKKMSKKRKAAKTAAARQREEIDEDFDRKFEDADKSHQTKLENIKSNHKKEKQRIKTRHEKKVTDTKRSFEIKAKNLVDPFKNQGGPNSGSEDKDEL